MSNQSVCFAYFGDGQFIGWYADSFGSIRPESPKVYSSLESMRETITNNFRRKVAASFENKIAIPNAVGQAILNASLQEDATELAQYDHVELWAVACPEYDGPNRDFDKQAYENKVAVRAKLFDASGIRDMLPGSMERFKAVNAFNAVNPHPKADNWIYADYSKVKEWAKNAPKSAIEVITAS